MNIKASQVTVVSLRAVPEIADYDAFDRDTFTVNAALGLDFKLGGTAYVRPEARGKWYEVRDDNGIDLEVTLAIGFEF